MPGPYFPTSVSLAPARAPSPPRRGRVLETDKWENVHFYERHGYTVIAKADVIGVPNWFMIRQPQRSE